MNKIKISEILQIIKLPIKYLVAIFLILTVLLFSPDIFLNYLGVTTLINKYRTYLGLAFICNALLIVSELLAYVSNLLYAYYKYYSFIRSGKKKLKNLTLAEKQILSLFIDNKSKSWDLPINNGSVSELSSRKIIYRSSEISSGYLNFSYNLNDWAWKYLNKNKELLSTA